MREILAVLVIVFSIAVGRGYFSAETCDPVCEILVDNQCENLCGNPVDPENTCITVSDAVYIMRVTTGLETCENCICDLDGDNQITSLDVVKALQTAVGQEVVLACNPGYEGTTTTTILDCSVPSQKRYSPDGSTFTLICGCGYRIVNNEPGCKPDPCEPCCKSCGENGWVASICPDLNTQHSWGPEECLGTPR